MSAVPGLTDTAEYSELWFRVTDTEGVGAAPGPFAARSALSVARRYQAAADALVLRYVQDMRAAGHTWREIGAAAGMSLQAAQQLHARGTRSPRA